MLGILLVPFLIGILIIPIGATMLSLGTLYSFFCLIPNHEKYEKEIRESLKERVRMYAALYKKIFRNKK